MRAGEVVSGIATVFTMALMPLSVWYSHQDVLPSVVDHRSGEVFMAQPSPKPHGWKVHRVTAYCTCPICCGQWADGITALGTVATQGRTIAADTRVWSMRSCLNLIDIGRRIVEDTGSAIKGNRIDVFMNDHEEARRFGVRFTVVTECV